MKTLKRIDPMSAAKVSAVVGAISGLIAGVLIATVGNIIPIGTYGMMYPAFGKVAILAIITMPIVYGIVGFIGGFIWSIIYNYVADKFGGIKIELK